MELFFISLSALCFLSNQGAKKNSENLFDFLALPLDKAKQTMVYFCIQSKNEAPCLIWRERCKIILSAMWNGTQRT